MPRRTEPRPGSRAVNRLRYQQAVVWREIRHLAGERNQRRQRRLDRPIAKGLQRTPLTDAELRD